MADEFTTGVGVPSDPDGTDGTESTSTEDTSEEPTSTDASQTQEESSASTDAPESTDESTESTESPESTDESTANDQPTQSDARTQINGFTGEIEPAAPLNLAPSPADQRILAAPPHTEPLPVLADRAVRARDDDSAAGVDLETHVGGSLTEDALPGETPLPFIPQHDTPDFRQDPIPVQYTDVAPPNDIAVDEQGAEVTSEGEPYPGLDTTDFTESVEARKEAEAQGTRLEDLPEITPPQIGEGITANEVGATDNTATEEEPVNSQDTPDETAQPDQIRTPVEPESETTTEPAATSEEEPAVPEEPTGNNEEESSGDVPVPASGDDSTSTDQGEATPG